MLRFRDLMKIAPSGFGSGCDFKDWANLGRGTALMRWDRPSLRNVLTMKVHALKASRELPKSAQYEKYRRTASFSTPFIAACSSLSSSSVSSLAFVVPGQVVMVVSQRSSAY